MQKSDSAFTWSHVEEVIGNGTSDLEPSFVFSAQILSLSTSLDGFHIVQAPQAEIIVHPLHQHHLDVESSILIR